MIALLTNKIVLYSGSVPLKTDVLYIKTSKSVSALILV